MGSLIHHAALALAAVALGEGALRVVSRTGVRGLARVTAALPLAIATLVLETLILGRLGLAASTPVLFASAVVPWLWVRWQTRAASYTGVLDELRDWWQRSDASARVTAGALVGLALAWGLWQLDRPLLESDSLLYHLNLPVAWLAAGNAGAASVVHQALPVGNYPLTNEVVLAWAIGLSRSWVIASIWNPMLWLALITAGHVGLRSLHVPRGLAWAALATLASTPLVETQLGGPLTDLPAMVWLVACATLCRLALDRPALLGCALLAGGLAIGTKTTPAILVVIALIWALVATRTRLRGHVAPLAAGLAGAAGIAGVWPLRNLIEHGSPLWPFVATPWGDPVPPALRAVDASLLSHPAAVLAGRLGQFADVLGGAVLLLALAVVLPLLVRTRPALIAGAVAILALLIWAAAPFTGVATSTELAVGAARYMLPALAACTLALAIGARDAAPSVRSGVLVALGVAVTFSAIRVAAIGHGYAPPLWVPLAGLLAGAAGGVALRAPPRLPARPAVAATLGLAIAVLALAAPGYLARHARTGLGDAGILSHLLADTAFASNAQAVSMTPATLASLAGSRFQHRLVLLPAAVSCQAARAAALHGWLVVERPDNPSAERVRRCLGPTSPAYDDGVFWLWSSQR
ncbi:MAG: hypothetical protein DLM64_08540 [Solirubrobacterales bacterium]|nr:MAG: hypothetical protein DLM64_08540 [Solirubrobacterales bacterium]